MEQIFKQNISWLKKRSNSFHNAWNGIRCFVQMEDHARIHLSATIIALMLGFYFKLSRMEWIVIIGFIAFVWTTEMINTAVEKTIDLLHPGHHPLAGKIKDMAAGAVLIASLAALLAGFIIFIPKIFL